MLYRAAQQQPKPWCVTNTFVGTRAKHSTVGKQTPFQPDPTQKSEAEVMALK